MAKKEVIPEPLPEGIEIGKYVSYYDEGWRVGTLVEVIGTTVSIKPMGNNKHVVKVGMDDIKKVG